MIHPRRRCAGARVAARAIVALLAAAGAAAGEARGAGGRAPVVHRTRDAGAALWDCAECPEM